MILSFGAFAQSKVKNLQNYEDKFIHFGFSIGYNQQNFRIQLADDFNSLTDIYGIESKAHPGFRLGPVADIRLGRFVTFRTLFYLSFNQRDLIYYLNDSASNAFNQHTMNISSTILELPLQIKFRGDRYNNIAPYAIVGFCPKYDLSANKAVNDEDKPKIQLQSFDPCGEIGGGLDLFLQYFKLSVELKYSVGFKNIIKYDDTQYSTCISSLKSSGFMLSLHFE